MDSLPVPLLLHIFAQLEPKDLSRLSLVCRQWYSLIGNDEMWRAAFEARWGNIPSVWRLQVSSWKAEYMARLARLAAWTSPPTMIVGRLGAPVQSGQIVSNYSQAISKPTRLRFVLHDSSAGGAGTFILNGSIQTATTNQEETALLFSRRLLYTSKFFGSPVTASLTTVQVLWLGLADGALVLVQRANAGLLHDCQPLIGRCPNLTVPISAIKRSKEGSLLATLHSDHRRSCSLVVWECEAESNVLAVWSRLLERKPTFFNVTGDFIVYGEANGMLSRCNFRRSEEDKVFQLFEPHIAVTWATNFGHFGFAAGKDQDQLEHLVAYDEMTLRRLETASPIMHAFPNDSLPVVIAFDQSGRMHRISCTGMIDDIQWTTDTETFITGTIHQVIHDNVRIILLADRSIYCFDALSLECLQSQRFGRLPIFRKRQRRSTCSGRILDICEQTGQVLVGWSGRDGGGRLGSAFQLWNFRPPPPPSLSVSGRNAKASRIQERQDQRPHLNQQAREDLIDWKRSQTEETEERHRLALKFAPEGLSEQEMLDIAMALSLSMEEQKY